MLNHAFSHEPAWNAIDPENLLNSLLQSAQRLLPCDFGVLALWDAEEEVLVPFFAAVNDDERANTTDLAPPVLRPGDGIIGYVAQHKQPLNVPDVRLHPNYREVDAAIRSELAVPILRDGQLLGVFNVESRTHAAYSSEHISVLQALADQAALVIETSRLYNRLRNNYFELQDAHSEMVIRNDISRLSTSDASVEQLCRETCRLVGVYGNAEACWLFLWDYDRQSVGLDSAWQHADLQIEDITLSIPVKKISELLVDNGKTLVLNRTQAPPQTLLEAFDPVPAALLALPLIARRRTIGGVLLLRYQTQPFTTQHIQRLQAPLDQIALSIDNKGLLREMRERLHESQSLLKLSEIATQSYEFDDTLEKILTLAQDMLGMQAVAILVHDRQDNVLVPLENGFGFTKTLYEQRFPVNAMRSLSAIAFNMGHPQYANDETELHGQEADIAAENNLRNMLVAPLRMQDHPLGVIIVANLDTTIDTNTARTLNAIASHIASVLRQFDYVVRLRLFRALSDISRRVSSELVSEHVLVAACQSVVEAIEGVDHAGLIINDNAPLDALVVAEYPRLGSIGTRLTLENYPVYEQMLVTREPVVINEVSSAHDLLGPNYEMLVGMGIRSLMIVPLFVQNEFLGSLGLDARSTHHHFNEAEIEFANAIAGQIAISMYNAQLFEQLDARTVELEEANRLKSEFLAKMSHELRTPMNSILGFSDLIASGAYGDLNEKQANRLARIQNSGRSLLALIDDLLDLSKIEAGHMELDLTAVNLDELVNACLATIEMQVREKQLALTVRNTAAVQLVMCDTLRLQQVLNNLLSNAVKFTDEGEISVTVMTNRMHMVQVCVADSGIGISQQHQRFIFDEFRQADGSTTRQYGGTGLGLAISRYLIEMMGGEIWVESEPGMGSTFCFTIPTVNHPDHKLVAPEDDNTLH